MERSDRVDEAGRRATATDSRTIPGPVGRVQGISGVDRRPAVPHVRDLSRGEKPGRVSRHRDDRRGGPAYPPGMADGAAPKTCPRVATAAVHRHVPQSTARRIARVAQHNRRAAGARARTRTEAFRDRRRYEEPNSIWREIKPVFMSVQGDGKGCFCERKFESGDLGRHELDIEHFRPAELRGRVQGVQLSDRARATEVAERVRTFLQSRSL